MDNGYHKDNSKQCFVPDHKCFGLDLGKKLFYKNDFKFSQTWTLVVLKCKYIWCKNKIFSWMLKNVFFSL